MTAVHNHPKLVSFLHQLASAPRRLLLLDYDGTLAPFCVERDQATPYDGVRAALNDLLSADHTRVVVISGRPAQEVPHLLALQHPVEIWGSHGAERLRPHGGYTMAQLPNAARAAFEQVTAWATVYGLQERFERKPAAVALHWRDLSARAADSLRLRTLEDWTPIARDGALELRPFDGGLELRAQGFDKGGVVRTLLDEEGDGVAAAYLGDDLTDEDAFQALGTRGLSVLVQVTEQPTSANLWLRPPQELLAFLRDWHRVAAGAPSVA